MDNIIKFLNLEDSDVELVDQRIESKRHIVTIRKKLAPHFCPVCSCRMHSKGIYPRTINHPIMQDDLQLVLIVHQRRWQYTNHVCRNIVTDEFLLFDQYKHNSKLTDLMIIDAFRDPWMTASQKILNATPEGFVTLSILETDSCLLKGRMLRCWQLRYLRKGTW